MVAGGVSEEVEKRSKDLLYGSRSINIDETLLA